MSGRSKASSSLPSQASLSAAGSRGCERRSTLLLLLFPWQRHFREAAAPLGLHRKLLIYSRKPASWPEDTVSHCLVFPRAGPA